MDCEAASGTVLFVVGPTAAGKTELAVRLSAELDGEVVSADSRQVYRFMDIGTAKPTAEQRAAAPHHLIDVVEPDKQYSLSLFLRQARAAIDEVRLRGRLPIVAGGTGQYVRALLEGWRVPEMEPDPRVRREMEARVEAEGVEQLHRELAAVDPAAAARVEASNPRRVIRALELYGGTESPAAQPSAVKPGFEAVVLGLTLEREALYWRVDDRVDRMIGEGWVGEVDGLLRRGYTRELSSMSGIGYSELAGHLEGEMPLDEAIRRTKYRTHRFVRQQYNWFRLDDPSVTWFDGTDAGLDSAARWVSERLNR